MRVKNTIIAGAALALSATSALAGGFDVEVVEAPVIVAEPAPAGSMGSLGGAAPALLALGAIGLAIALTDDDHHD